jgi:Glycosyl hydrolases family 18
VTPDDEARINAAAAATVQVRAAGLPLPPTRTFNTATDGGQLTVAGVLYDVTLTPHVTPTPTPPPVTSGNLVTIGKATFPLAATNPTAVSNPTGIGFPGFRGTNQMVEYTPPASATATNQYGVEVTVGGLGTVTAVNDRQVSGSIVGTVIPSVGYVLSGHGLAAAWLSGNATVGAAATISTVAPTPTPTPVPTPTPTPTPVTTGGKTLAVYQMMWSGDGSLASIPKPFNEIRLAFAQGSPPALVGWADEGQAQFVKDAAAFRAAGGRILVSVGGSGGAVNVGDHAGFVAGITSISTQLGGNLDGVDWDLEAVPLGAADAVAVSSALKAAHPSSRFSFAPNGSNVDSYLAAAVACQNAGTLDCFGQQFYDAPVSESAALGRINQAIAAGIPANKITVGVMLPEAGDNTANYWTPTQAVQIITALLAAHPDLQGAYFWEASRPGTFAAGAAVGPLFGL